MVYRRHFLELPYNQIAKNLICGPASTVYRTVKLFDETGTVCSIQGFHENTTKKLNIHDELAIFEKVLDDPSVYLHDHEFHTSGNNISTSSICRFLHQQCFSHKKLTFRAQQRSEQLREKYTEEMSLYNPETLIFVDETGCDRRAALRRYMVMPYRGNQPSVIGCLSRESGTMLLVPCAWMVCLMYISKREQWVAMSSAILLNYASCHNCYHSMGLVSGA